MNVSSSLRRPEFSGALLFLAGLIAGLPAAHATIPSSGLVAAYPFNTGSPNADSTGLNPVATSKYGVTRTANRFGVANSAWGCIGTVLAAIGTPGEAAALESVRARVAVLAAPHPLPYAR